MEFPVKKENGHVVVTITGDLDTLEKSEQLKETLNRLSNQDGEKEIVLNLDNTKMINSYGIGKLLMFHKRLKDDGGCLYITPPKDTVKEILETLMLDKVLKVYEG